MVPGAFLNRHHYVERESGHLGAQIHQHIIMNNLKLHWSSSPAFVLSRLASALGITPYLRVASQGWREGVPPFLSSLASPSCSLGNSPCTSAALGLQILKAFCLLPLGTFSLSRTLFPRPLLHLTSPGWYFRSWHPSSILPGPFPDTPLTPRVGEHPAADVSASPHTGPGLSPV